MFFYLLFINYEGSFFDKIRVSSFNVVSILSGTGYVTDDFGLWGKFSLIFFLFLCLLEDVLDQQLVELKYLDFKCY